MVDDKALVETGGSSRTSPRRETPEESPFSVTEQLEQSERPFDHKAFRESLKRAEDQVIETGEIIFFPLLWGMPDPAEYFEKDNRLRVHYDPDHIITYPEFTLRRPVPHQVRIGPFVVRDYTSEPDPMTERDVNMRVEAVQNFDILTFPNHANRFNQMNGITVMTDPKGIVRISLNCPYPFPVSEESPVKPEWALPVPYNDSLQMRVFCAAVLNEMGFEPDFVYRAVGHQPRTTTPESAEKAEYEVDKRWIVSSLSSVPALGANFVFDLEEMASKWLSSIGTPDDPEEVYRIILTSARFEEDGNITFKTTS